MKRKRLVLLSGLVVSTMLALNLGYVQAQTCTPGQILQCDPGGTGTPVDSVITQDPDTGNVGLGTASPVGALDVSRSAADAIFSLSSIGAQRWQLNSRTSGLFTIGREGGGNPISITPSGNVGIGTVSPQARLHVAGETWVDLSPGGGGKLVIGNNPNDNKIYLEGFSRDGTGSADEMLITGRFINPLPRFSVVANTTYLSGNVGIGTYNPAVKLHVVAPYAEAVLADSPNTGVFGRGTLGIRGYSANGSGVSGATDSGFGVWTFASSSSGYAGYFNGRVYVNGNLSKASGSFKIDHPLDPANKYLYHSFVESPDMMNLYNGVITLDDRGEATVTLPEWFEALNRDFRYQLTALGAPGPNLYIAEKVAHSRFKIAGGQPGAEVSWQVTGIRQDAWANAHRIPVEEDKAAAERGFYLHPELHGQPEEKGIEWAQHPDMMRQMKAAPPQ